MRPGVGKGPWPGEGGARPSACAGSREGREGTGGPGGAGGAGVRLSGRVRACWGAGKVLDLLSQVVSLFAG